MKKQLLVSILLLASSTLVAQDGGYKFKHLIKAPRFKDLIKKESQKISLPANNRPLISKPLTRNSGIPVIDLISIGTAGNAFGLSGNGRTYLWAEPALKTVTYCHRANSPSTGYLQYDVSKNSGLNGSWSNNVGPVYTTVGTPPNDDKLARYPQGAILNPGGNTYADSAYYTYFSPLLDGSNGADWGGIAYGVYQLSGKLPKRQHIHPSDAVIKHVIPTAFHVTQTGNLFSAEPMIDMNQGANGVYLDSMLVSKGSFDASIHDISYTFKNMFVPMSTNSIGEKAIIDQKIAFAPDGLKGWISIIGHNDFTFISDSVYYPILYKTDDGGTTWTGPYKAPLESSSLGISNWYNGSVSLFSSGYEHDLVVDKNGNPHVLTLIAPSTGHWDIDPANGFMTDLSYENGQWNAFKISGIQSYEGAYGSGADELIEYNRAQASINYKGDVIFYTWFDTDTLSYSGLGNTFPDMYSVLRDLSSGDTLGPYNFTLGTVAEALVTFGSASYYVFEPSANIYEIPVAFQQLNGGSTISTVQLNYIQNARFDFVAGLKKSTSKESFDVSQNIPNPCSGSTNFQINLKKSSKISLSVYSVTGQKIFEQLEAERNSGIHSIQLNCSSLSPGVYFCKITAGGMMVSRKILVQN